MKVPAASTYRGICTDKHPSFDTLDEMIEWAVERGATHMSLSNYHGGAFFKAKNPNAKKSYCEIMHFGDRYDWDYDNDKLIPVPNGLGWYCSEGWSWGDTYNLEPHDNMYPFFSIGYDESDKINDYLRNMQEIHDYTGKKSSEREIERQSYYLTSGTVQAVVASHDTSFYVHFGRAEYQQEKPVVSKSIRRQAQPVIDGLNSGEISENEAKILLEKIWF
jgi:hypothetical protein